MPVSKSSIILHYYTRTTFYLQHFQKSLAQSLTHLPILYSHFAEIFAEKHFRIFLKSFVEAVYFKSNVRETWRVILVREADIFLSESLRILAERLSQSEIGLPLRQIYYYSPPEEVVVFSTEIKSSYKKCINRVCSVFLIIFSFYVILRIELNRRDF